MDTIENPNQQTNPVDQPPAAVAQPAPTYDSNPFTTAIAGIKKLFDHNLGLLVGASAFMFALMLLIVFALIAFTVSFLGIELNHPTDYVGTSANLVGSANITGNTIVALLIEMALGAVFGVLFINLTHQVALTASKGITPGFGATLKRVFARMLPGLGLAVILFGAVLAPFIVLSPLTVAVGSPVLIILSMVAVIVLIYCGFRLSFVWFVLLEGTGPIESIKRSWQLTSGHLTEVLGSFAVGTFVMLVPVVILQILSLTAGPAGAVFGLLVLLVMPAIIIVTTVSLSERFVQLSHATQSQQLPTKPHPTNYLAIGLYLVIIVSYASLNSALRTQFIPTPQSCQPGDQESMSSIYQDSDGQATCIENTQPKHRVTVHTAPN